MCVQQPKVRLYTDRLTWLTSLRHHLEKRSSSHIQNITHEHKASIVALLRFSTCCASSASVSTHFTLHFHSAAFHIPPHQGGEGGGREITETQTVCFSSYISPFSKPNKEFAMYLGSSPVPQRTPAPLCRNLEIWNLECKAHRNAITEASRKRMMNNAGIGFPWRT